MQPTIELAKSSNTLNKLTFVLLYATDFADRLEKEIIPALKAGFVVLTDRYIYTALARAGVRGVDRAWLRSLYGFAIAPHLVFYLKIDVDTLIGRVLASRGMDFWESGMDLKHGDDIYDSFRAYQQKLLREYASMADEFHFRVVDARRSIDKIQDELGGRFRRSWNPNRGSRVQEVPGVQEVKGPRGSDRSEPLEPMDISWTPGPIYPTTPACPSALRAYASCPT